MPPRIFQQGATVPAGGYLLAAGYAVKQTAVKPALNTGFNIVLPAPGVGLVNRIWSWGWGMYGTGVAPSMSNGTAPIITVTDSVLGQIIYGVLTGLTAYTQAPNYYPNTMLGQVAGSLNASLAIACASPGVNNGLYFNVAYEVSPPRPTDLLCANGHALHADNPVVIAAPGAGKAIYLAQVEWGALGTGAGVTAANPAILTATDSVNGIVGYSSLNSPANDGGPIANNQNTGWVLRGGNNASLTLDVPDLGANMTSIVQAFYRIGPA